MRHEPGVIADERADAGRTGHVVGLAQFGDDAGDGPRRRAGDRQQQPNRLPQELLERHRLFREHLQVEMIQLGHPLLTAQSGQEQGILAERCLELQKSPKLTVATHRRPRWYVISADYTGVDAASH